MTFSHRWNAVITSIFEKLIIYYNLLFITLCCHAFVLLNGSSGYSFFFFQMVHFCGHACSVLWQSSSMHEVWSRSSKTDIRCLVGKGQRSASPSCLSVSVVFFIIYDALTRDFPELWAYQHCKVQSRRADVTWNESFLSFWFVFWGMSYFGFCLNPTKWHFNHLCVSFFRVLTCKCQTEGILLVMLSD